MSRTLVLICVVTITVFMLALPIQATTITFNASLSGLQEVPPNASPATGLGIVVLDDVAHSITVNLSWNNLNAIPTAAHIHGPAAPGVNAVILFNLSPWLQFSASGVMTEQTFSITDPQILDLEAGLYYFNIHTSVFPGGEIRGQIEQIGVPEPGTLLLLGLGIVGILGFRKRSTK
jgi:hypothetical protein